MHPYLEYHVAMLIAHADLLVERYNLNRMQIALLISKLKQRAEDDNQDTDNRGGVG